MTDEERARALKKRLCGDSTDCDERTKTILAAFTAVREEEWRDSQLIRLAPVLLNEFGASEALPGISTAIYTLRALRERAERDAARADNARLREALALALDAVDAVCNYFGNAGDAERVTLYKEQTARARALTGGPR